MKLRAGVLLCGCGAYDGTDPHEAILSMLSLQGAGIEVIPLAYGSPQFHVVDHTTALEQEGATRSMLVESARMVRGKLYSLEEISPKLLELLIIPGGQGPVKSLLSGFSTQEERRLQPDIEAFLLGVHRAGGILGAISLAEFILSSAFGPWPDGKGCFDLAPDEVLVDHDLGRVLTPGYTLATSLPQLAQGIENMVSAMVKLLNEKDS